MAEKKKKTKKKSFAIQLRDAAEDTLDAVKTVLPGNLIKRANEKIKKATGQ